MSTELAAARVSFSGSMRSYLRARLSGEGLCDDFVEPVDYPGEFLAARVCEPLAEPFDGQRSNLTDLHHDRLDSPGA
jgi:hypothetical protein